MEQLAGLACLIGIGFMGCTPAKARSDAAATGGHGAADPQLSHRDLGSDSHSVDGEGFHFELPQHQPHRAPRVAQRKSLSSLPPFQNGSSSCFNHYDYEVYHNAVPQNRRSRGPTGGGRAYSSGSGAGSAKKSGIKHRAPASAPRPAAAPRPKPSARPSPAAPRAEEHAALDAAAPRESSEGSRYAPPPSRPPQHKRGQSIYLSNDDTMSLSSAQRVIYAIDQFAPIPAEHVRPHELLNYFSFKTDPVAADHDFSVRAELAQSPDESGAYSLGFAVQGRPQTRSTRRNANLAYVIDRSGSMQAEGRMEYLKEGLLRSVGELKHGDIVHLTLFDGSPCQLAKNFVVGRDSSHELEQLIRRITPTGSTNLHAGLEQGYQAADAAYQPDYSNRVILITDANTNTGVTNDDLIALVGQHYDQRRIRLSGVGVGRDFNDALLDRLTERGKGAYVFLGSRAEVGAVFGSRFVSLIETVANDVHFQLRLPPSLAMKTFYGEEASTQKERVQAIHYFANTSQMFLSDVQSSDRSSLHLADELAFTIEYEDPETGVARREDFSWRLGDILGDAPNLKKAQLVSRFARDLSTISARQPQTRGHHAGSWRDQGAAMKCQDTRTALHQLGSPIQGDPEARRVMDLWDTYCSRYQSHEVAHRPHPEPSQRNNDFAPPDTWPSATR